MKRDLKAVEKVQIRELRRRQRWTGEEAEQMIQAAILYGKDYLKIAQEIGTKSRSQVAKYANDLYHKAITLPNGSFPNQAMIRDTFKPYGLEKQAVCLWMKQDQEKFIEAVRKHGQDWDKISQETGLSHNLMQAYTKLVLK